VLAPDPLASTVDATLWYRCGTRHETTAQDGLAALSARMSFRNGATGDPLAPLEAEGGTGSLAVTPDDTSVSATGPAEGLAGAAAGGPGRRARVPGRGDARRAGHDGDARRRALGHGPRAPPDGARARGAGTRAAVGRRVAGAPVRAHRLAARTRGREVHGRRR